MAMAGPFGNGAASLCSKALAMDEKEQFPERAEFDAVIRKAEQKGRESTFRCCPISHNQKLGNDNILRPHFNIVLIAAETCDWLMRRCVQAW